MKVFFIVIAFISVSMYFFPFEFTFLKGINTKQIMAPIGFICLVYDIIKARKVEVSKELFVSSLIAITFSAVSFYSTDFNHTSDYAYAVYIGSMWVWLLACYAACTIIRSVHGYISILLIVNYLSFVCVFQCVIALLINFNPPIKEFVDSWFITGDLAVMMKIKRLYGIGASLDVAGGRFSAVMIMIAVLLNDNKIVKGNIYYSVIYFLAFLIIGVLGSIMARTTTIGLAIGSCYFIYRLRFFSKSVNLIGVYFWQMILIVLSFITATCTYFYNTDKRFYTLLRFGFEGFFNLIEKGRWETDSTEVLKDMWVFPTTIKTWIIGDGYFFDIWTGLFYMRTDVGYLRFIYYSGLLGLLVFTIFFFYLSFSLANRFNYVKNMFYLLLVAALANWIKVSTDLFLVYSFFLVLSQTYFTNYYRKDFEKV